jgi:hypothetical protein
MSIEAMKLMVHELEYVLDCINKDKIPFDGDDFHEALRLGRQAIDQAEKQEPVANYCRECLTYNGHQDGCSRTTPQPQRERVIFPTMLRKMWSGGEVQAWLDENVNKEKNA